MASSVSPSFEGLYHSLKQLETRCLQMVILFCHTILVARKKKTTNYRTPAQAMGMFSAGLGGHLEELFTLNKEMGDPLYGALVVNSGTNMPSEGFFGAARRHGLIDENLDDTGKTQFWQQEAQKVFAAEVSGDLKELLSGLSEAQRRDLKTLLNSESSH